MSDFSPKQLRIISYALSRMCQDMENRHMNFQSTMRTNAHSWKHGPAVYRVKKAEFTPNQALSTLGHTVNILEAKDE